MAPRLELQTLLTDLLGSENVYFQAPSNLRMEYPCIRYELDAIDTEHADNNPYSRKRRYKVMVIDQDPDSTIQDKVGELPLSRFQSFYVADNLNHFVYNLYF